MVNAVNEIDVTKLKCICRWYGFKSFARLRLLKIVDFIVVIVVTANFSLSRFRCQVIGRGDGLKAVSQSSIAGAMEYPARLPTRYRGR